MATTYYVCQDGTNPKGPVTADWIRANITPTLLISHGETWLPAASHPDFHMISDPRHCIGCQNALAIDQNYCTNCGIEQPKAISQRSLAQASPAATERRPARFLWLLHFPAPGLPQLLCGQTFKGLCIFLLFFLGSITLFAAPIIYTIALVDAYRVVKKARRWEALQPWEFLP